MKRASVRFEDRIAGGLALSALGDAFGWVHEPRGLAGEIGDPERPFLPVVDPYREARANPWNLWFPARITKGRRGVPSDDTACRLGLIEPWLAECPNLPLLDFVRQRGPSLPLRCARRMAKEIHRTSRAKARGKPYGFHVPGVPVNWGPFVLGSLALAGKVLPCELDEGYGVDTTRAYLRWCAGEELLDVVNPPLAGPVQSAIACADEPTDEGFLNLLAGWSRERGVGPFDPLRQLGEAAAAVARADGDPERAIRLAGSIAGDSDTVASHVGLVVGFRTGLSGLRGLETELQIVEETTQDLFGVTLPERVGIYASLAEPAPDDLD